MTTGRRKYELQKKIRYELVLDDLHHKSKWLMLATTLSEQAVEQMEAIPVIWEDMMLMRRHHNARICRTLSILYIAMANYHNI